MTNNIKINHGYLSSQKTDVSSLTFNLENRRYIGSKYKLCDLLKELLQDYTKGNTFFDVFAGTGIVTKSILPFYDKIYMNDFLYSNNIIYQAFFGKGSYSEKRIIEFRDEFQSIQWNNIDDDYFVNSYGNKFFSSYDARIIGEIRTKIDRYNLLNDKERAILIASLLYSVDKIANTVGHYDAYRKNVQITDRFNYGVIKPIDTLNKDIEIFREDANNLVKQISADVVFIDPPYNSRQYSRFYHLLEGIAKWDKPVLSGVAMKPPVDNISEYSKSNAPQVFDDLIMNLDTNYIVVTYNNTYKSKSSSSKNKISHDEILYSLNKRGKTLVFEKDFSYFNAGKTSFNNHKEFVFITKVKK